MIKLDTIQKEAINRLIDLIEVKITYENNVSIPDKHSRIIRDILMSKIHELKEELGILEPIEKANEFL